MGRADIQDPQLLRDLRGRLAAFLRSCAGALGSAPTELSRTQEWLGGEQQTYWKAQLRRREEAYQEARRVYLAAESDVRLARNSRGGGRQSSFEERLAMDRAKRAYVEAEEKLALIRRWQLRLQQDGEPLAHQCMGHDLALREQGDRAVLRLARMADEVEAYLAASLPAAGRPAGPGGGP